MDVRDLNDTTAHTRKAGAEQATGLIPEALSDACISIHSGLIIRPAEPTQLNQSAT